MSNIVMPNELGAAKPIDRAVAVACMNPSPEHKKSRSHKAKNVASGSSSTDDPIGGAIDAPKASRKVQQTSEWTERRANRMPDYAALGVPPEQIELYEVIRLKSLELGRKPVASVFEWGGVVAELHDLEGDQKRFALLTKELLRLSRRGAENYESVYRKLQRYRSQLEQTNVVATCLYDLATGDPERVEKVIAVLEDGQNLTRAQIKTMLGQDNKASASPDDGGPEGLRAAIALKTVSATGALRETLFSILREVHIALEAYHAGRDVNKGKAVSAVMHDARLAGGLLESLVYAAQVPGQPFPPGVVHIMPVEVNRWSQMRSVLYDMGAADSWPKNGKSGAWLAETVVPQLEWALGPILAEKAKQVLEQRAATAEAEQAKAEALKQRVRADAKKAREKMRSQGKSKQAKADKRVDRQSKAAVGLASRMGAVFADMSGGNA